TESQAIERLAEGSAREVKEEWAGEHQRLRDDRDRDPGHDERRFAVARQDELGERAADEVGEEEPEHGAYDHRGADDQPRLALVDLDLAQVHEAEDRKGETRNR